MTRETAPHDGQANMIKRTTPVDDDVRGRPRRLELEELADVDVTSEEPTSPIEGAFARDAQAGWRTAAPGPQFVRLRFRHPVRLTRLEPIFEEPATFLPAPLSIAVISAQPALPEQRFVDS